MSKRVITSRHWLSNSRPPWDSEEMGRVWGVTPPGYITQPPEVLAEANEAVEGSRGGSIL